MPRAGFGLPAAAVADPRVAGFVADHGVTVFADGEDDLALVRSGRIRPVQVVLNCTGGIDEIRRAISAGVRRFATRDDHDMAVLSSCVHRRCHVYLDAAERIPEPRRPLEVAGVRCRIDDAGDLTVWASEAERMVCRLALLNKCGIRSRRLCMIDASRAAADYTIDPVVTQIDNGIRAACERWRLPIPAVSFVPAVTESTAVVEMAA